MPHCILEYSANIPEAFNTRDFFSGLHRILAGFPSIDLERIKSRAIRQADFMIGSGASNRAFISLQISLMSGRSEELRQKLASDAHAFLHDHFAGAISELDCSVSVEIREIDRGTFISLTGRSVS
jgi:5-carboxymethyl-2-hydroxymuconate isomerase